MLAEFTGAGQEYRRSRAHLVTRGPGRPSSCQPVSSWPGNALYHK